MVYSLKLVVDRISSIHRTVRVRLVARQVILGVPRPRAQSFLDGILQGFFGLARGPMDL
jgi:hypothetical protein